jgi:hypothetical protein
MDLLSGYDSDDEQAAPAASPSSSTIAAAAPHAHSHVASQPSAAFLAATAAATIAPDTHKLPPGEFRPEGVRAETAEERAARKEAKKAAKQEKKEKKLKAAAPAAKLVLPSADALLSGLGATAMGVSGALQSGEEADSEGGSPAPSSKSYNALPPPATLLAGDQLSEEAQWKLKPMQLGDQSKKRRFVDIPNLPTTSSSSAASAVASAGAARPAASTTGASSHARFAPPQVARKQANLSTEDVRSAKGSATEMESHTRMRHADSNLFVIVVMVAAGVWRRDAALGSQRMPAPRKSRPLQVQLMLEPSEVMFTLSQFRMF